MPDPIFSPSDPLPPTGRFRVGGRVLALSEPSEAPDREKGTPRVLLGDAFGLREVALPPPAPPIGALCIVEVRAIETSGALLCDRCEVVGQDRVVDAEGSRPDGELSRLWTSERGRNLRRRAELLSAIRGFFADRHYIEVETPALVPSPGLDLHLDAFEIKGEMKGELPRYLTTSPEYQMKRLLAGGMPRIFQIARCFRRGELGPRHNPEFTMLEWYRAFGTFEEMIDETEALIVAMARVGGSTLTLTAPFERLPVAEAFARHAGLSAQQALALALSPAEEDEERFHRLFVERVEPALAEGPPVVLVDYPVTQASLARKRPDDPRLAERFEILVGGVELCNGFGELVDPVEQRARFEDDRRRRAAQGKAVYPIDERFLGALAEGLPPCAGNALGLDRLIALCLGAATIGDVQTFPAHWL
jgi:lysyl-tRNA synthetase class 2